MSRLLLTPASISKGWFPNDRRHIHVESDFYTYSRKAAEIIIRILSGALQQKKTAVFVPSAGKSPLGIYNLLRSRYRRAIDWQRISVIQMDEYWGLPDCDPKSLSSMIRLELIYPLSVRSYIHFFDEQGKLIRGLREYEQVIEDLGGIDLVVHGIGRNGHIGFNEPGSSWESSTRRVQLTRSTLEANVGRKEEWRKYHMGVTLGIRMLRKADHAVLLLSGRRKRTAVKALFLHHPSRAIPASSLSQNLAVDCVIDSSSFIDLSG